MLYSADCLRPGHAATCFGRNQLFPTSIGLSPLDAGHASDLHISTANGPPRSFRHASTYPRLDRPASGRIQLTPRTFIRRASLIDARMSLSLRLLSYEINLASQMHSLVRSSKRMSRHRHRTSYRRLAATSFGPKILSRRDAPSPADFRLFSHPYPGSFSAFGHPTTALSVSRRI